MTTNDNSELDIYFLPGYTFSSPQFSNEHMSKKDSEVGFQTSLKTLEKFIQARNPNIILAKTAFQRRVEYGNSKGLGESRIEQGQLEVLQALCLVQKKHRFKVPTAPNNFVKLWPLIALNLTSFLRKQTTPDNASASVISRIRTQTLYYRNIFDIDGCDAFINPILKSISSTDKKNLGFSLLDIWNDLKLLGELIGNRQNEFALHIVNLKKTTNVGKILESINFFKDANETTKRAYQFIDLNNHDLEYLHYVGYQLSELANTWIYTFSKNELLQHFSEKSVNAFFKLSIRYGEINVKNTEHLYLDNPVWSRPFIENSDGSLFAPIIELIYGFPFKIIQTLIGDNTELLELYFDARANRLETTTAELLESALPSASIYKNVKWTDPVTQKEYENDVVTVIGNHIIIFEVKSGKLRDATRRGGSESIQDDFESLFIEPARQAIRLEHYLNEYKEKAILLEKKSKLRIRIDTTKPKVVLRYAVCIENLASITSGNQFASALSLESDTSLLAPILSIGELQMLHRLLDTEVSFLHYLSRRFTIQEELTYLGDEQDLLSVYLTNGFNFDKEALKDKLVVFKEADLPVRQQTTPRKDRQTSKLAGLKLSPLWQQIVDEVYTDAEPQNKFDFIEVILNQHPCNLNVVERKIRLWRRGARHVEGDNLIIYNDIGARRYALTAITLKKMPSSEEWRHLARDLASEGMYANTETPKDISLQCVSILIVKRTKQRPFDAVQFNRVLGFEKSRKDKRVPYIVP